MSMRLADKALLILLVTNASANTELTSVVEGTREEAAQFRRRVMDREEAASAKLRERNALTAIPATRAIGSGRAGVCASTADGEGAGCATSDLKGSWPHTSLAACFESCAGCTRCYHISFSRDLGDCSWFRSCPPALRVVSTGRTSTGHRTFQVRHEDGTMIPGLLPSRSASIEEAFKYEGVEVIKSKAAACLGANCMSWDAARSYIAGGPWQSALPAPTRQYERGPCLHSPARYAREAVQERKGKNCVDARRQLQQRAGTGLFDMRNVTSSLQGASEELKAALAYKQKPGAREDWLPSVTQSLYARSAMRGPGAKPAGRLSPIACAQARCKRHVELFQLVAATSRHSSCS